MIEHTEVRTFLGTFPQTLLHVLAIVEVLENDKKAKVTGCKISEMGSTLKDHVFAWRVTLDYRVPEA